MENLKLLRKQHGLSQQDLANILHASQNTVSQWESGKREPNHEIMQQLADYFGVSTDYLLGRENRPANSEPVKELTENVIIYHRNGKTVEKKFTKEEMEILTTMIDSLKGVQNDEDL